MSQMFSPRDLEIETGIGKDEKPDVEKPKSEGTKDNSTLIDELGLQAKPAPKPLTSITEIFKSDEQVAVGRTLDSAAAGQAVLSELARGNPNALNGVGLRTTSKKLNGGEWGLFRTREQPPVYFVVKGGKGSVNINGEWAAYECIGHTHPEGPQSEVPTLPGKFGELLEKTDEDEGMPGIQFDLLQILPSADDFMTVSAMGEDQVHMSHRYNPDTRQCENITDLNRRLPGVVVTTLDAQSTDPEQDERAKNQQKVKSGEKAEPFAWWEANIKVHSDQGHDIWTGKLYAKKLRDPRMGNGMLATPKGWEWAQKNGQ